MAQFFQCLFIVHYSIHPFPIKQTPVPIAPFHKIEMGNGSNILCFIHYHGGPNQIWQKPTLPVPGRQCGQIEICPILRMEH
ncbi:hypothetical protein CFBP3840_P400052 (plasmid) [Pseudomonas syringae]|uniref:Uncharacterized protein n=1 Tax=Pseudomonas syringae TaxID=317 RepID=A0A2K4X466_PSESX|nr:hypothetical protein ALP31_200117 [Pseudomonas amygdali pv. morsprunorum]SOS43080.1 hypothetical protein CFBP3840_P400052 [Pseudomonas syringae]